MTDRSPAVRGSVLSPSTGNRSPRPMAAAWVRTQSGDLGAAGEPPIHPRLLAMILAGRYHGIELDPGEFRGSAGRNVAVRRGALDLGAELRNVVARGAAALAPPRAVPQHRTGGAAVHRRHRGPADRRQHRAQGRLHQGPARPASRSAGAGGRAAAGRSLGAARPSCCAQAAASPRPTRRSRCAGWSASCCRRSGRCARSASPRSRSAS